MNLSTYAKALVLLSGGQDSATCLAVALKAFPGQVEAIGFDYGQRHRIELDQAAMLAEKAQVPFTIMPLAFIPYLTSNALTDPAVPIETHSGQLPSTFVPGRNLFFLSTAAVVARQKGIHVLYTGVCETDYSGYPDCREEFIISTARTISLAMDFPLTIETPLMHLSKAETVLLMEKLGKLDWYRHTHTCYKGEHPPCDGCPACILRKKGFSEAGINDPLFLRG